MGRVQFLLAPEIDSQDLSQCLAWLREFKVSYRATWIDMDFDKQGFELFKASADFALS